MENLKEFVMLLARAGEKSFLEIGEQPAAYHIITGDGDHIITAPPPRVDKDLAVKVLRHILKDLNATRCAVVDEGWMMEGTDLDEMKKLYQRGINDLPDSKEVISIMAEDQDEGSLFAYQEIIRSEGRKPILGPLTIERSDVSEGRMVGLLPRKKLHS